MKFGVLVFPGSNCDHDTYHVAAEVLGEEATMLWHASTDLEGCDAILVPGGFAYGDYLRTGAIAKFAPIMQPVKTLCGGRWAGAGHLQWLPDSCGGGAAAGRADAECGVELCVQAGSSAHGDRDSPFTRGLSKGEVLRMPVGHMEGNYFCDAETLRS